MSARKDIAKRSQLADKPPLATKRRSFYRLNERARLSQQVSQLASLLNGFARKPSILQSVFITAWSPRSWGAAVHPTTSFPAYRRRHARFPGARSRTTTQARKHRTGITQMITRHLFVCAVTEPAYAPTPPQGLALRDALYR
jgi:hypothetical protein